MPKNAEHLKKYQFKKGNPGGPGRPPKLFGQAYERRLLEVLKDDPKKRTRLQILADSLVDDTIRQILAGRGHAVIANVKEIADRVDGKAVVLVGQAPEAGPLEVIIQHIGSEDGTGEKK